MSEDEHNPVISKKRMVIVAKCSNGVIPSPIIPVPNAAPAKPAKLYIP